LASLAGLPRPEGPQPIDGIDLTAVLKNPDERLRDHAYHAYRKGGHMGRAIRTERYRLVEWQSSDPKAKIEYELYDYAKDPLETKNVSTSQPKVLARMIEILKKEPPAKSQVPKAR